MEEKKRVVVQNTKKTRLGHVMGGTVKNRESGKGPLGSLPNVSRYKKRKEI